MTATVTNIKEYKAAPKAASSRMDTIIASREDIEEWALPPFQRPKTINAKVRALAEQLKQDGGVIPGVITIGTLPPEKTKYIVDGQHRIEAFKLSDLGECIMDARICKFESMAEMADEFVTLNSAIVKMRPDDVLRGMEGTFKQLARIRQACPYVGYDMIRRGQGPVLGMSSTLRCWHISSMDTPASTSPSAVHLAQEIDAHSTAQLIAFLEVAERSWGRDPAYYRLWSNLNLILCMWLWRRLVLDQVRTHSARYVSLNTDQFKKCMMSLSAASDYLDWLPGRAIGDRDRSPAYSRIRQVFIDRLKLDGEASVKFPQPAWFARVGGGRSGAP